MRPEKVLLSSLHLWEDNPRGIEKGDFEELKERLANPPDHDNKQFKPLVVNQDNIVLGGNMRLRAMRELDWKEVDISRVKTKNKEEMLWYALVDNEKSGYYEGDKLAELSIDFPELESIKIDLGKSIDLKKLLDRYRPVNEDEAPPAPEGKPGSILGGVYELGRHRLMCGDSTKRGDVEKLMAGKKADMVFTDPPYGVEYVSGVDKERRKSWGSIHNDDLKDDALREFLYDSLCLLGDVPLYVCCNWQSYPDFYLALGRPNNVIVWDKEHIGLGSGYRQQYELICFYGVLDHNSETNVWRIGRDSVAKYNHPTQKPVTLAARALKNSSKPGDIVLDLFGGSGSTLIACEQLGRSCYIMELDPRYCDVIIERYNNYVSRGTME